MEKRVFRQLGEALEVVGPSSGVNDLLSLANARIRFPRQCTIPMEGTLAMREVNPGPFALIPVRPITCSPWVRSP